MNIYVLLWKKDALKVSLLLFKQYNIKERVEIFRKGHKFYLIIAAEVGFNKLFSFLEK